MNDSKNGRNDDGGQLMQLVGIVGALLLVALYARLHSWVAALASMAATANPVTSVLRSISEHPSPASVLGGLLGLLGALLQVRLIQAAIVLMLVLTAVRAYATWRTLQTRVARVVIPPDDLEPSAEAIAAFGYQLLGVRRRILRWLDRPASAVTFKIVNGRRGRVLYMVEAPGRTWPQLEHALRSAYRGLELLPADEFLPATPTAAGVRHVKRLELRPARESMYPLREVPDRQHDGLTGVATVAEAAAEAAAEEESVVIALSLEPVGSRERVSMTRHLLYRAGQDDHGALDDRYDSRPPSRCWQRTSRSPSTAVTPAASCSAVSSSAWPSGSAPTSSASRGTGCALTSCRAGTRAAHPMATSPSTSPIRFPQGAPMARPRPVFGPIRSAPTSSRSSSTGASRSDLATSGSGNASTPT